MHFGAKRLLQGLTHGFEMTGKDGCPGFAIPRLSSEDGFVRLSLDGILRVPLVHLLSGTDRDLHGQPRCGMPTSICGYSEWVSRTMPRISLGWDWRLSWTPGLIGLVRVGSPRSNVLLIDRHGVDFGWQFNLEILGTVVDALPWREDTGRALSLCTL